MEVIKGILIMLMVAALNISFYFWGRRDGFDRCHQLMCEYFLEKLRKGRKMMPLMTNAEAFLYDFGIYATELWSMPEAKFLEWLNAACDRERPKHWPAPQCMACRHFHAYLDEERKDSDV